MAGLIDNMKDKFGDMDSMKAKFEELKSKDQNGELDDKGKAQLEQLRSHFNKQ